MKLLANFLFLDKVETVSESNVLFNNGTMSQICLQIGGTGEGFKVNVKGRVDNEGDFVTLSGVNLSTLNTVSDLTANGIYTFDVSGLVHIKVSLTQITSGKVTALGRCSA